MSWQKFIQRISDPTEEIAFLIVIALAHHALLIGKISDLVWGGMLIVALVTLLGTKAYQHVRLGVSGVQIGGDE